MNKPTFRVTFEGEADRDVKADYAYTDEHGNLRLEDREVINGAFVTFPRLIVRDMDWKQVEPIEEA